MPPSFREISFALLFLALCQQVDAAEYHVTILDSEPSHANGNGIDGEAAVGSDRGNTRTGTPHAVLWPNPSESFINLHPSGFGSSRAFDIYGSTQVGDGFFTGQNYHALLWHGSAESVVDLHPQGFHSSTANAVTEKTQAGAGKLVNNGAYHALLWYGTAESVIDLHVTDYSATYIWDAVGEGQVGWGAFGPANFPEYYHALLWRGTAESVIDLHPTGYITTFANGGGESVQVGYGIHETMPGISHALLWQGTAESVVDLHPAEFRSTNAEAAAGIWQVGRGYQPDNSRPRALAWMGTAESVIDLHSLLEDQTGLAFSQSLAVDVDRNGNVVGWGDSASGRYAIRWTLVPEPTTLLLAAIACLVDCTRKRRIQT